MNNGETTVTTTSDINNVEYYTHDKCKDIFSICMYDFHV